MAFDDRAFAAALIDLAVRGYLRIEAEGEGAPAYRLPRRLGASLGPPPR